MIQYNITLIRLRDGWERAAYCNNHISILNVSRIFATRNSGTSSKLCAESGETSIDWCTAEAIRLGRYLFHKGSVCVFCCCSCSGWLFMNMLWCYLVLTTVYQHVMCAGISFNIALKWSWNYCRCLLANSTQWEHSPSRLQFVQITKSKSSPESRYWLCLS